MPADRRAFRDELAKRRDFSVAFDWDCTLSSKHLFKVLCWSYARGVPHPHYQDMLAWIAENEPGIPERREGGCGQDSVGSVLDYIEDRAGRRAYIRLIREFFMGGEDRILELTVFFRMLANHGGKLCVLTAGVASGIQQALVDALPEWLPFFPSSRVHDCSAHRHQIASLAGVKILMQRDLLDTRGFFVDDSLAKDTVPDWVLTATSVTALNVLKYEQSGLQTSHIAEITQNVFEVQGEPNLE